MQHRAGLAVSLVLLVLGMGVIDGQVGAGQEEDDEIVNLKEREAHTRMKAAADFPVESKRHQEILDAVEADLVELYDHGRGHLAEPSLILLGDLAQRTVSKTMGILEQQEVMNHAGIYYEDAFEKHNSTNAYFKLGKVVESLGVIEGTVGNESGKELLIDQANKMFLVCGAHRHLEAMKSLVANCEKHRGFAASGGCPHSVQTQARHLNEELLKVSPSDPLLLGKLAIFWAQGLGVDKPDLPKACQFASQAAAANVFMLTAMDRQALGSLQDKDYDEIGYNTNNYILHGNCKYFNNFQNPGKSSDRSEGRDILTNGMKTRHLGTDELQRLEEHLMSMIGPEEEPTYSGHILWHNALNDDLGEEWFVYIWLSLSKGFFWSQRLRLGDVHLRVKQREDGLADFAGDHPHFWLKAEGFQAATDSKLGQLWGHARRKTGEDSFLEGNFSFALTSQALRTEL